jgi:hypothetical protein
MRRWRDEARRGPTVVGYARRVPKVHQRQRAAMADNRLPPDRTPRDAGFRLWWIYVLIIIFGVIAVLRSGSWNQRPASHYQPAQAPGARQ